MVEGRQCRHRGGSRGSEFIEEVKGFFFAELKGMGLEDTQANQIAGALADVLRREYGGGQIYIPMCKGVLMEEKWRAALEEYSRGRLSVEDLARKIGVARAVAYRHVRKYLAQKRVKAPCPAVASSGAGPLGFGLADQAMRLRGRPDDGRDVPDEGGAPEPVEGGES